MSISRLGTKKELKGNTNVLVFLGNGVGPKRGASALIDPWGLLHSVGKFNAALVRAFPVAGLDFTDDAIPFPQDLGDPPAEMWPPGRRWVKT